MQGDEFVRGVMDRLGVSTAAELAEVMRWKRGTERTVARWLAGDTRPSFDYVMEMVEQANLLNTNSDARPVAPAPLGLLGSLEAKVDQMAEMTADSLARLEAAVTRLSQRRQPAAGQSR
jgi:hypothetical protein